MSGLYSPPNFTYKDTVGKNCFENCIFYEVDFEAERLNFYNCEFKKYDTSTRHVSYFGVTEQVYFSHVQSDVSFSFLYTSSLLVFDSRLHYIKTVESAKDTIDEIKIMRSSFIHGIFLSSDINKLTIEECQILKSEHSTFSIFSNIINTITMVELDLSLLETYQINIDNPTVTNIEIYRSKLPSFFDLNKKTMICLIQSSDIDYFDILKRINNPTLFLTIINCTTMQSQDKYMFKSTCKELNIADMQIDGNLLIDVNIFHCRKCEIKSLQFFEGIDEIFISDTTIDDYFYLSYSELKNCFLNTCTIGNINLKFTSINKLAIYQSNFKELDFDCSFIDEARFVGVKGVGDEGEVVDLTDKHFASKESLEYFKSIV